jgi:hypothetical protein
MQEKIRTSGSPVQVRECDRRNGLRRSRMEREETVSERLLWQVTCHGSFYTSEEESVESDTACRAGLLACSRIRECITTDGTCLIFIRLGPDYS